MISMLLGVLFGSFLTSVIPVGIWVRMAAGWNAGAMLYLILILRVMMSAEPDAIRVRALRQKEGTFAILTIVLISAFVCLGSIVMILGIAKELTGLHRTLHIVLATLTVLTSWVFTQVMFANHYAHDYYLALEKHQVPGLHFPGTVDPDYLDFLYFSCVIGTSGQTADVDVASKPMRNTSLVHCIFSFFFNATLIALTINISASLI